MRIIKEYSIEIRAVDEGFTDITDIMVLNELVESNAIQLAENLIDDALPEGYDVKISDA